VREVFTPAAGLHLQTDGRGLQVAPDHRRRCHELTFSSRNWAGLIWNYFVQKAFQVESQGCLWILAVKIFCCTMSRPIHKPGSNLMKHFLILCHLAESLSVKCFGGKSIAPPSLHPIAPIPSIDHCSTGSVTIMCGLIDIWPIDFWPNDVVSSFFPFDA
jgi:hypothetical protein